MCIFAVLSSSSTAGLKFVWHSLGDISMLVVMLNLILLTVDAFYEDLLSRQQDQ